MRREAKGLVGTVRPAVATAVVLGIGWILFVVVSLSEFVGIAWANHVPSHVGGQNVIIGGVLVGRVELYRLLGNRGLNVYFHPANNDLNVINTYGLNWWQAVNRPQEPGVPDHIDTINSSSALPGVPPGDDNDPSYYTNNERTHHVGPPGFNPNQIFAGGNWWMVDFPGDHINIRFETWLVRSGQQRVEKLVCFNWGFADGGGVVTNHHDPSFVNGSIFNLPNLLDKSGFGRYQEIASTQPIAIPSLTLVGLMIVVVLVLLSGAVYLLRS